MSTQGRSVQSVEKAIVLLDCFWQSGGSLSLSELVQQTGWAKSTVHGLLASMLTSAVVEQDKVDGRYRLGYHLFELGSSVANSWDVVGVVRPYLEKIANAVGEGSYLVRLSGDELILAEFVEPRGGFSVSAKQGSRIPIHCTAQGRCILAAMPEERAKALLQHKGMYAYSAATVTRWEELQPQLALTREMGYSMVRNEYIPGLRSIGSPIYTSNGSCIYAIGTVGILPTGSSGADRNVVDVVKNAAAAASYDLGWRGNQPRR